MDGVEEDDVNEANILVSKASMISVGPSNFSYNKCLLYFSKNKIKKNLNCLKLALGYFIVRKQQSCAPVARLLMLKGG